MSGAVREWIAGIVTVSILCSVAIALTADAPTRRVVRMAASAALLLAAIWPLRDLGMQRIERMLAQYTAARSASYEAVSASAQQERTALTADVAQEKLAEYLKAQAASLGITCSAKVEVAETDGALVPVRVEIRSSEALTNGQKTTLSALIVRELGISQDKHAYKVDEQY